MKELYQVHKINHYIEILLEGVKVDEETGEIISEELDNTFEKIAALQLHKEELVRSIALTYKNLSHQVDFAKKEIERIQRIKKNCERVLEKAKQLLEHEVGEGNKLKNNEFEIGWRKSEVVDDTFANLEVLHTQYPELINKTIEYKTNKNEIKRKFKETGTLPEGIEILPKNNIQIK